MSIPVHATETSDTQTCLTCRFWDSHAHTNTSGTCRRMPPGGGHWRPSREGEQSWIEANWPDTSFDEWCGEHRPEPEE